MAPDSDESWGSGNDGYSKALEILDGSSTATAIIKDDKTSAGAREECCDCQEPLCLISEWALGLTARFGANNGWEFCRHRLGEGGPCFRADEIEKILRRHQAPDQ